MAEKKCSPANAGANPKIKGAKIKGAAGLAASQTPAQTSLSSSRRRSASVVCLCIPEDQCGHLRQGQILPIWPADMHPPRQGEVIYLDSESAWGVELVVNEFRRDGTLRIEVWLAWLGATRRSLESPPSLVH